MQTASEALAAAIGKAADIVLFFTEDLKGNDWLHRPCAKANCAAWTMGHLILSARSMMSKAGATDLPPLPEGFEKRFARDDTAPFAGDYGDVSQLREIFKQTHDRFVAVAKAATPAKLAEAFVPEHRLFKVIGDMFAFAPTHIATHAGQISTIRRSLGRAPLV